MAAAQGKATSRSALRCPDGREGATAGRAEEAAAEDGSGGGFKETAVMLRRQLKGKGFSTMRECV